MFAEKYLWTAVIFQAVCDLGATDDRARYYTRAWLLSNSYHVGSFRWVCDQLDLSVSAIARDILNRTGNKKDRVQRLPFLQPRMSVAVLSDRK